MRFLKKIKYLIFLLALWVLVHVVCITIDGLTDRGRTADIAVVLGSKVNSDGTLSERLEKRIECGLQLYKDKRVSKFFVSGGIGNEGFGEGDKMKEYLVRNGVPDSLIIVDNFGVNTRATVRNMLSLRDSLKFTTLIVVSQYFHVSRTKMLFRRGHFYDISSVSPSYFELRDFYSIMREFVGYYTQYFSF